MAIPNRRTDPSVAGRDRENLTAETINQGLPRPTTIPGILRARGPTQTQARRHKKRLRDQVDQISKSSIRRLARRGGCKRVAKQIYNTIRDVVMLRTTEIIGRAVLIVEYRRQKTVTDQDIVFVLKQMGQPLWGFGQGARYNGIAVEDF